MNAGPHLDDDALSAHLDGLDAGPHLAACDECRARLDGLAAASAAIGTPVALPAAAVIDAAVEQALDAETRGPRRTVLVALAAAVLVVLGVVGVAVVGDEEERPPDTQTAALSDESTDDAAGGGSATFAGDLGELDDQNELRTLVQAAVEPPPTTTTACPNCSVQESAGAPMAATAGDSSARSSSKDPYCEQAVAEDLDRGLGPLVYRATLRWNGTPAVAVAYRVAEGRGELDHRLFVLSSGSCELLVAQTF